MCPIFLIEVCGECLLLVEWFDERRGGGRGEMELEFFYRLILNFSRNEYRSNSQLNELLF